MMNLDQKIKCIIVDDEPLAADGIKIYADKLDFLTIEAICYSAVEALTILNNKQIDLIFLDVNMPDLTGIEFLEQLQNPPLTIFTTAYSEFAVDGFRMSAIDYLLKPISFPRFVQAVQKVKTKLATLPTAALPTAPINNDLYLKQGADYIKISVDQILYIEAMQNYIIIHQLNHKITAHQTISAIEALLLNHNFFRVHKSFLINIAHIDRIRGNIISIKGNEVPLSKQRKNALFELVIDKKLINK